jgi:hypothetical protein
MQHSLPRLPERPFKLLASSREGCLHNTRCPAAAPPSLRRLALERFRPRDIQRLHHVHQIRRREDLKGGSQSHCPAGTHARPRRCGELAHGPGTALLLGPRGRDPPRTSHGTGPSTPPAPQLPQPLYLPQLPQLLMTHPPRPSPPGPRDVDLATRDSGFWRNETARCKKTLESGRTEVGRRPGS